MFLSGGMNGSVVYCS